MAKRNLDKKWIDRLPLSDGPAYLVWDEKVGGLHLAVGKTAKRWKFKYDLWVPDSARPKTILTTLGTTDEYDVKHARAWAAGLKAQIQTGINPNAPKVIADAPTVKDAYEAYVRDAARPTERKPLGGATRSIEEMKARQRLHLSDWSTRRITDITKAEVREKHRAVTAKGMRIANHVIRDFRAVFNHATRDMDPAPANPVGRGFEWNPQFDRAHTAMDDVGLAAWWDALAAERNPIRRAFHEFKLLSGARFADIDGLRREWINWDRRVVALPAAEVRKRGKGRGWAFPLSLRMVEVLREAVAAGDILFPGTGFVFPAESASGYIADRRLGRATYSTRHTYATVAAKRLGLSDIQINMLQGRAVAKGNVSESYINPDVSTEHALQERMTEALLTFRP